MYLPFVILVLVGVVAGAPTASIEPMGPPVMYLMPDGKLHMSQVIDPFQQLPSFFPSVPFLSSISKPTESVMLDKSEVKIGEKNFVTIPSGPGFYYALPLINEEKPKMPGMESRSNIESKEMPEEAEEAKEIAKDEENEEKLIEMDEKFEEPEKDEEMPKDVDEKFEEPEKPAKEIKKPELAEIKFSLSPSDLLASLGSRLPISWLNSWPSWLPHLPVSLPGLTKSPARLIYYPQNQFMYYIPAAAPIEAAIKEE